MIPGCALDSRHGRAGTCIRPSKDEMENLVNICDQERMVASPRERGKGPSQEGEVKSPSTLCLAAWPTTKISCPYACHLFVYSKYGLVDRSGFDSNVDLRDIISIFNGQPLVLGYISGD
jgi:hypothetical protein